MILPVPAMTNAQRQKRFQKANPGYDARRKARERASLKRHADRRRAELIAQHQAKIQAEMAEKAASLAPVQLMLIPVPNPRLALPAPVELPILPAINDLHSLLKVA